MGSLYAVHPTKLQYGLKGEDSGAYYTELRLWFSQCPVETANREVILAVLQYSARHCRITPHAVDLGESDVSKAQFQY